MSYGGEKLGDRKDLVSVEQSLEEGGDPTRRETARSRMEIKQGLSARESQ